MIQVDRCVMRASPARVFACARDVERWPEWLPHYRWVRFLEREPGGDGPARAGGGGIVEMAAWREFGPLRYPVWWVSRMEVDPGTPALRYHHLRGITRGMEVEWAFEPLAGGDGVAVRVTHRWEGPPWPLLGAAFASGLVGPVFVHGIARRTLAGIALVAAREDAAQGAAASARLAGEVRQ